MERLISNLGANSGCFMFENYLEVNLHQKLLIKIKNHTFAGNLSEDSSAIKSIEYENSDRQTYLKFTISSKSDIEYLHSLAKLGDLVDCLNKTFFNSSKLYFLWNNPVATMVDNRYGKSISISENIISVNPHSCTHMKPGMSKTRVPINFGFTSHFRKEDLVVQKWLTKSIKMIKIDIEYYFLLVNSANLFV